MLLEWHSLHLIMLSSLLAQSNVSARPLGKTVHAILDENGNMHFNGRVFSVTSMEATSETSVLLDSSATERHLEDDVCLAAKQRLVCAYTLGFRSTSAPGGTSKSDCFCQPGSFFRNRTHGHCAACPLIGVECLGGFVDSTGSGAAPNQKLHRLPTASEGYWMIDSSLGVAARCTIAGACLAGNECLEGHVGFACGTCDAKWTADFGLARCRSCDDFPGTVMLVLQILVDLTFTLGWNFLLAFQFQLGTLIDLGAGARYDLVALVRLYTHWVCQVSVLSQYNLTHLRYRRNYGDVQEEGPEEGSGVEWPHTSFGFPNTRDGPQVGSVQEALECLVARNSVGDTSYWKLMAPAIYWALYPVSLFIWTIVLACFCVGLKTVFIKMCCKGVQVRGATFKSSVANVLAPWLVVTMSNACLPMMDRFLQMAHCEHFPLGNIRLMMHTDVTCWTDEVHSHLTVVSTTGLFLWCLCMPITMLGVVWQADKRGTLQSPWFQRTFAFFLQGYGPRRSSRCWDLLVKRMDLLALALIRYTSMVPDVRGKIILWAMQAAVALALQLCYMPYSRAVNKLNYLESFGLAVRFCLFAGVSLWLLTEMAPNPTNLMAWGITVLFFMFLFRLCLYSVDDWFYMAYHGNL